jgi:TPP-dependent pyruvate/acetoin dehydrogenase alpha subunit
LNLDGNRALALLGLGGSKSSRPSVSKADTSGADRAVEDFRAEAKKSPIDRLREAILKRHGLSQDQFEALPADKQGPILKEIEDALKQRTETTGGNANVLA